MPDLPLLFVAAASPRLQELLDALAAPLTTGGGAAFLSFIFNRFPVLARRFDRLTADGQRSAMSLMLVLLAVGFTVYQANGWDWQLLVANAFFALVGNQATDRITPKLAPKWREEEGDGLPPLELDQVKRRGLPK